MNVLELSRHPHNDKPHCTRRGKEKLNFTWDPSSCQGQFWALHVHVYMGRPVGMCTHMPKRQRIHAQIRAAPDVCIQDLYPQAGHDCALQDVAILWEVLQDLNEIANVFEHWVSSAFVSPGVHACHPSASSTPSYSSYSYGSGGCFHCISRAD